MNYFEAEPSIINEPDGGPGGVDKSTPDDNSFASETTEDETVEFLNFIYQNCPDDDGNIQIRFGKPDKHNRARVEYVVSEFVGIDHIEDIPRILKEKGDGWNCWYGAALRKGNDGTKEGVYLIPFVWLEDDNVTPEVEKKISEFPLKPSAVIQTSKPTKRQYYWLLKIPVGREEISRVETVNRRLISYFEPPHAGTHNADRVLRLPGTLNPKYDPPLPCTILELNPECQYELDDFDILPEVSETSSKDPSEAKAEINERLNQIMECEFLKHCDRDRVDLPEPHWYAMVNLLCRETGGPKLIHHLSRGYPKYSQKETDEKILHALDVPPYTCEYIKANLFNCEKNCGVASPAVLRSKLVDWSVDKYHLINGEELSTAEKQEVQWVWDGRFPAGGTGLLLAKPKVGKTVFAFNVGANVSRGDPFLGWDTTQGTVIYLALEESREQIKKYMKNMGSSFKNIYFHFGMAPKNAVQELIKEMEDRKPKLVIIDILQKFLRVKKIEDYAEITIKLEPVVNAARNLGTFILFTHHAPKTERELVDSALGSTGLVGGVDTVILIKKDKNGRRSFSTLQRYRKKGESDVEDLVINLAEDDITLELAGTISEVNSREAKHQIIEVLKNIGEGKFYSKPMTESEIREEIKRDKNFTVKCLKELYPEKIQRSGNGRRNDPYRYSVK